MNAIASFILWPVTLCYAVASVSFMVEGKWHLAGVYACYAVANYLMVGVAQL